ncbi:MAG: hypothetical protein RI922_200 [Bacteroidota bacterium]|jgi:outer membrane protein OmpA-like peptidoglycan-associated protein
MRSTILLCFFFLFGLQNGRSQVNFNGVWQGLLIRDGQKQEQATLFYTSFIVNSGSLTGKTRDETYNTDFYAVKQIKGSQKNNELSFNQTVIEKKKNAPNTTWCKIESTLTYNDSTGYLEGRFKSTDCKNFSGKIILYRSKATFSANDQLMLTHIWRDAFISDLKKGYNAPEIREKERRNFDFQPIYFDYDKAEIRKEYFPFLDKMIRIVDGHSDIRIKVTGHTDADGSEEYNVELSKKRAEALINYFVSHGLSKDRIEIDFKGEKDPIDSNDTPEGKQHNRRVDFAFI